MSKHILFKKLSINNELFHFINDEVLPGTNIDKDLFWQNFSDLISNLTPVNKKLIEKRFLIQKDINDFHKKNIGKPHDELNYLNFLKKIGYLIDEGPEFKIDTTNIDPEIATISGPQLVVPITNARYVLNAVNARWGSLYDAVYGTDVLGDSPNTSSYDYNRGLKVINYAKSHLDKIAPLSEFKWSQVVKIKKINNSFKFFINEHTFCSLKNNNQIIGYNNDNNNQISELILIINNLHIRILIDPDNVIGENDPANISDIIVESAISVIIDCEDSVATVDAEDKIEAYRNWLGLMKGTLKSKFTKNSKLIERSLKEDFEYKNIFNKKSKLKGRALMLVRNVGHLMTTSAILDQNGDEIGEGIMDAVITSLIAVHDLKNQSLKKNSIYNSVYIVKPKMHGPEEVAFTNTLFDKVESILNLPKNTLKVGIMDEERRTSVNLKECIRSAKSRLAFINTGFLDRTGDEIHTSMYAGPFLKKSEMKKSNWITAYENRNVLIGLECGLMNKAQIGKGMWAMPDKMSMMIDQKIEHPMSGANCAWVPSPTAATLHSLHYHFVNVKNVQTKILSNKNNDTLTDLLKLPLLNGKNLSNEELIREVENNTQGILGYVVRWINQGIGCSKVLDINNVGLMEDRATCRISSQAISNWILHKIISEEEVLSILKKMAKIVDEQNINDPNYINMSPNFNGSAFTAAMNLIFNGIDQPSGYTEPILHKKRKEFKEKN